MSAAPIDLRERMTQYAPYPHILAELIECLEITTQPTWRFSLADIERDHADTHDGAAGGLTFIVQVTEPDAYQPGRMRSVVHYFPVPAATYAGTSWARWMLDQLMRVQCHEMCEGFTVAGRKPFAPTHGPGDDPYVVVQYASDTQRRTSFRGEVQGG